MNYSFNLIMKKIIASENQLIQIATDIRSQGTRDIRRSRKRRMKVGNHLPSIQMEKSISNFEMSVNY